MAGNTIIYRAQPGYQEMAVRTNVDVCFGGGNLGAGKLHPLDTRVLTPNGWVAIGDLREGDLINTPFGVPAMLLHIFEHKGRDIYRLTTSDGRSVECGLEHLWSIRTEEQMCKYHNFGGKDRFLTTCDTAELIKRLKEGERSYLPVPDAQEFSEKDFVIPPYILGVMIGDGCLTDAAWVGDTAFYISNTERDVIGKIMALSEATGVYGYDGNSTKRFYSPFAAEYKNYCAEAGLNTYPYSRFIPEEYLWGSIRQRRELLAGLFDAGGHVADNGCYSYLTTSRRLCEDVTALCRSLGYIVTVPYDGGTDKHTDGKAFKIRIQTPEKIFSSKRHSDRWEKACSKEGSPVRKRDHVYVVSIERTRVADARCIYIDDPLHLYIVDDYIVTHNTFGAALATAEPSLDPRWRGLVVKNNIDDLKRGGGVTDTWENELFVGGGHMRQSEMPRFTFPGGAYIDFCHVADQSVRAILRRFKSSQYDWIYFDELSEFTWDAFKTLISRNRGKSAYAGKILATTNPERECWIRDFIDWYIGEDGTIRPDRNGVVRYFFIMGNDAKDVCWGDSKDEVYAMCRAEIDESRHGEPWEQMVKSFVFYQGHMSENKLMLANNPGYMGTVAMMGGAERKKLLGGNWNVSSKDEEGVLVTYEEANAVFTNDEQRNNDRWVTCDLADLGANNFLALAWDGLHIIDIEILTMSRPKENAEHLRAFAARNNVADSHIIFDAVRAGIYINDYIPNAVPFEGYRAPMGVNALQYMKLKDCCYGKLIYLVKNGYISCSDEVAKSTFLHQKIKDRITIQEEFVREIRVVRFTDAQNGKKRLLTKKEMNKQLGSGQSMDLCDPMAMRMYPLLNIADGYELESTRGEYDRYHEEVESGHRINIYDDAAFGVSYGR